MHSGGFFIPKIKFNPKKIKNETEKILFRRESNAETMV